jgi:hypothetical protein
LKRPDIEITGNPMPGFRLTDEAEPAGLIFCLSRIHEQLRIAMMP